jgi:F-type H+-transporting ATPase subunit delta
MLADPVGRVYAEALFGIARDRMVVDDVGAELSDFRRLALDHPEIGSFLSTPVVEPSDKVAALREALEGRVSPLVADFLCLVVEKRRFGAFAAIVDAYRGLADAHAGRLRASLRTAAPVAPALEDEIAAVLGRGSGGLVVLDTEVDPALLGGAVVTVDDRVYDGSLRTRLRRFRQQLIRSERP